MPDTRMFDIVNIEVEGSTLDYAVAKKLAETVAANELQDPMIVAWYDGKRKQEHPHVPECQHKPGWIAYAEGHDGKLQVNINKHEYSFIFTGMNKDA